MADLLTHLYDADCSVSAAGVEAAAPLVDGGNLRLLLEFVEGSECRLVWPAVAIGLAGNDHANAADALIQVLEGADIDERRDVARVLASSESRTSRRVLEALGNDPSASVRRIASGRSSN